MSKKMSKLISVFILIFPIMIIAFTIVDFQSEPMVNYGRYRFNVENDWNIFKN